ncbi:MAG: phage shock protein A [Clostridiales bacterium]|nr:MAG: phage shock protein A [Clostridiales bacterium]
MSILSRFKDIMSANINALLDKCEDPAKMIDQYLRQLKEDLAEVKQETAAVMAEEKRTKRLVDDNAAEIAKYTDLAKKALTAGNEGDVKVFITKKQELEAHQADLEKTYALAHANAEKMREMHDKLTGDIQELEQRRLNVKAKMSVAKTQDKLNKINDSMKSATGSMEAFERMEAKADRLLDEANSMAELNEEPKDSAEEIAKKYDKDSSVDDELAKMKAELGL